MKRWMSMVAGGARRSAMLLAVSLSLVLGCLEFQALVGEIGSVDGGSDGVTPPPQSDDDAMEEPYGPFPPDDSTPDDETPDDETPDDETPDDESTIIGEEGEDLPETLAALPADAEVQTLDSGLQVYDYRVGTGDQPQSESDSVVVDYAGYLQRNGEQFDTGLGSTFGLSGVIDGFAEGILGMKVGGQRRIIIPPDLGYGSNGNSGAGIGGDDVIVFDVRLIEIK